MRRCLTVLALVWALLGGLLLGTTAPARAAETVTLTIASVPSGLQVTFDGNTATTPFTVDVESATQHAVSVANQPVAGVNHTFSSWSDGGAASHSINAPASDDTLTVTMGAAIWPDSATPAVPSVSDGQAIELGTKFRADTDGTITALRFYKGLGNDGAHIGRLWRVSDGALLAEATYTGETASGWQQVTLPAPVAVQAGVTYLSTLYSPDQLFPITAGYFASAPVVAGPLTALQAGTDGPNGVYRYGSNPGPNPQMPVAGNNAAYFSDVVFVPPPATPDETAPVVSDVGATPALTTATVTWTTDEPATSFVRYGTSPGSLDQTATTAGLATGHTVVLTGLTPGTTYHYRVESADAAANTTTEPTGTPLSFTTTAAANEIVSENLLPGNPSSEWQVAGAGDPTIQGFTTDISVDQGGTVSFKVDLDASTPAFHIDIYRLGWYDGDGARKVATIGSGQTTSTDQPACLTDAAGLDTGLVDCGNWSVSATWTVPSDAVSGIYIGRLVREDTQGASHVPFVVRDDDGASSLLFQTSDTTWQAYNQYGGNSLYGGSGPGTGGSADGRAYKVSYNRPLTVRGNTPEDSLFNAEFPMLRWLERNGYDVSYAAGVDTDRAGAELLEHDAFLSVGHDEYWSGQQRANVEAARAAGVHLAFFSGNEVFWKTRWESAIDGSGATHRTLVAYKETHDYPNNPDPSTEWTGTWRDPRDAQSANQPENGLTGTIFTVNCCTYDMVVPDQAGLTRLWRNTSVAASPGADSLGSDILGYEWDEDLDNGARPANAIRMSRTTLNVPQKVVPSAYGSTFEPGSATHSLVLYKASSGALVFGAGTVQWSWGLDDTHDRGSAPAIAAVQQATANLFSDMGVSPGSPQGGLVVTGPSTDTTAPTVAIDSPTAGASVAPGTVTVQGTAADVGGAVGAVEVSTDGGSTWHPAEGWTNWTYSFPSGPAGTEWSVLARAVDDSFNVGTATSVSFSVVTQPPPDCPCTIFGDVAPPLTTDSNDYELGVRFQSSVDGVVTGVRFYKGASNTGTHVGHLWTEGGTLLATATFSGETATGWQEVSFGTPVAIAAGTNYIASYTTPNGNYAFSPNYFTSQAAVSGVLTAPQSTPAARNGVYSETPGTFPTQSFNDSNYFVDVVFDVEAGPDLTAPTIVARTPAPDASSVAVGATVRVTFDEPVDEATLTEATVSLSGPGGPVAATVTYESATRTAVLTPGVALDTQTLYTVMVKGGALGVRDVAGNPLAADSTWTFTTAAPPPDTGPGGPIAVITNPADPFSRYYAEILRAEGLNAFELLDLGTVDASRLADFEVAILGRTTLSPEQVTMLTDWVNDGGDLVAMRPDPQLATLLGLAAGAGTLAEGYLGVDTSTAPGEGITAETMQFHGAADRYTLAGATAVARLYTDATTSTTDAAVTWRSVGGNGGHAGAFTFDLARSVVLTRQGNPAWAGQERDGQPGLRSDDLFYGDAAGDPQPDWVDLNKVAIPQADEQQRLLANVLGAMSQSQLPLPRLWYLPRGEKAAVVLTGDDHGGNGTTGRFDYLQGESSAGCDVAAWECVRATSYIYPGTSITDAQVAAYQAAGFEVALHPDTGCATPWTEASLRSTLTAQTAALVASRPSIAAPVTSRTHCIAWSDWATMPRVERDYGVRLDTNYYYWPQPWIQDRPGLFTGSGFPMRFADVDGSMIDVYQAATQMTDESGQSYPYTIDTLLDRALGVEGYYGTFTANMHTDTATPQANADIVDSAQARGVPVISAKQLLTWLDGRNGSSFQDLAFDGTDLTFTMSVGSGADGLEAMLPIDGGDGTLQSVTRDGSPVTFVQRDVKGVTYAVFPATPGAYAATYAADSTPPAITGVAVTPKSTSATISWTTDEPATSEVQFGTDAGTLSQSASTPGSTTSHTVTLTGLVPSTTYHYRVVSADALANTATSPPPPAAPSQFTTRGPEVEDTTVADFTAGSGSGTSVVPIGDGAVELGTSTSYDFGGTELPAGLTAGPAWTAGGAASVSGGSVAVDGTVVRSDATYGPGSSIEWVATFGASPFAHVGFGTDLDTQPWAFFSTGNTTNTLYARTKSTSGTIDTPLTPPSGSYIGSPHRYRIESASTEVRYFVDGVLVQTHAASIASPMQVVMSEYNAGGTALSVDEMTVGSGVPSGTFTSRVLDAGEVAAWTALTVDGSVPPGTAQSFETRSGATPVPDGSWSAWAPVGAGSEIGSPHGRYVQYRAVLSTADPFVTPRIESVVLSYARTGTLTAGVLSIPADAHGFTVLVDGVPFGSSLTPGQNTGPITIPVGTHRMSLAGAGDTNLASYGILFVGGCALDGWLTIAPGGSVACAAVVIHTSNPQPTYVISDPQVVRPPSGPTEAVFTVSRVGLAFFPGKVNFATQDGTAEAGTDYTATSGTLTFNPTGPTTQTVSVPISATSKHSVSDTFDLVLSSPVAGTLADNVGTAEIINPNGPISVHVGDVDHVRSTTVSTTANFTVSLSSAPAPGEQVAVQVNTTNGTAVAGTDYTALPATTVTFGPGEQTKTVGVAVPKKSKATPSRAFNLVLSNPSANAVLADTTGVAVLRSPGTATPPPTASVSDSVVLRPASGSTTTVFTVTLSSPAATAVSVNYATQDGTATSALNDYTARSGVLSFAPGQVSRTVAVTVRATQRHALFHDLGLVLSAPTGVTLADDVGTARLMNLKGRIGVSALDTAVVRSAGSGGTATITLSLPVAPATGESVTVNVATADATAIAGNDYTALASTPVTFTAGQKSKTVTVPVSSAAVGTPVRRFLLVLSGASSNAFVADAAATVSLIGP